MHLADVSVSSGTPEEDLFSSGSFYLTSFSASYTYIFIPSHYAYQFAKYLFRVFGTYGRH